MVAGKVSMAKFRGIERATGRTMSIVLRELSGCYLVQLELAPPLYFLTNLKTDISLLYSLSLVNSTFLLAMFLIGVNLIFGPEFLKIM